MEDTPDTPTPGAGSETTPEPIPPAPIPVPTPGRIVRFVLDDDARSTRPAIIVSVTPDGRNNEVNLTVFMDEDDPFGIVERYRGIPQSADTKIPATWHWPERT